VGELRYLASFGNLVLSFALESFVARQFFVASARLEDGENLMGDDVSARPRDIEPKEDAEPEEEAALGRKCR
jgi:hypothetical protein